MFRIFIVSLPGSPKRDAIAGRLRKQNLAWDWIDGVKITDMESIPMEERNGLEAYCIPRLRDAPEYVCRAIGCKRAMRRAIDAAASCSEDWVIILQDDAHLVPDFKTALETQLQSAPPKAGAIMLHRTAYGVERFGDLVKVSGNVRSMAGFAVRPSFALVMSEALSRWSGEADRIWEELAKKGELILSPEPQLVLCNQKGSDIIGGIPELSVYWK